MNIQLLDSPSSDVLAEFDRCVHNDHWVNSPLYSFPICFDTASWRSALSSTALQVLQEQGSIEQMDKQNVILWYADGSEEEYDHYYMANIFLTPGLLIRNLELIHIGLEGPKPFLMLGIPVIHRMVIEYLPGKVRLLKKLPEDCPERIPIVWDRDDMPRIPVRVHGITYYCLLDTGHSCPFSLPSCERKHATHALQPISQTVYVGEKEISETGWHEPDCPVQIGSQQAPATVLYTDTYRGSVINPCRIFERCVVDLRRRFVVVIASGR